MSVKEIEIQEKGRLYMQMIVTLQPQHECREWPDFRCQEPKQEG
jgi:hypothetical protein